MGEKREFTFNEYMYYCVMHSFELNAFFTKLYEYGEQIDDHDSRIAIDKFVLAGDDLFAKEFACAEAFKKVESLGVTLSGYEKKNAYQIVVPTKGEGFAKNGKYDCTYTGHPTKFNGLELDESMLKSGQNPYLNDYLGWIERNKGLNLKLSSSTEQIKKLEAKLSKALIGKEKIRREIAKMKSEISYLDEQIKEGEKLKTKKDVFDNLTKEQKEAIYNALVCLNQSMDASKDLKATINEYNQIQIKYNAKKNRTGKWERAYTKMLYEGAVDERTFNIVNDLFNKVLKYRDAKNYPEGIVAHAQNTETNILFGAIDWYASLCMSRGSKNNENAAKKAIK